ncbi:glycosyl hydrolases family 28-domain-containing protein [Mycena olivaceomarginata]|nr:glycosyl hydrolases family 28-domain-containing protein [Mycena olivaceomarginata]
MDGTDHMCCRIYCLPSTGTTTATTTTTKVTSTSTTTKVTSTTSTTSSTGGTACTVTAIAQVASATASCTAIVLSNLAVPSSTTLNLSKLKTGTTVTFAGKTTFAYTDWGSDLIEIGGEDITIQGASGSVIDGNGQAWWDGQGSNGGTTKPDHFVVLKTTGTSLQNLYIQNWPVHCFEITSASGTTITGLTLYNSAGNAPNSASGGLPAAHNSDGFDVSGSTNIVITETTVINQDDCVAVTSGTNITVSNMVCDGGHGLSIGSVGGKSDNDVLPLTASPSVALPCPTSPEPPPLQQIITISSVALDHALRVLLKTLLHLKHQPPVWLAICWGDWMLQPHPWRALGLGEAIEAITVTMKNRLTRRTCLLYPRLDVEGIFDLDSKESLPEDAVLFSRPLSLWRI